MAGSVVSSQGLPYQRRVNRHLTIASNQLELQANGYLESCLFHLHLATVYYLREIAETAGLATMETINSIQQLQLQTNQQQLIIAELNELSNHQQWNYVEQQMQALYQPQITAPLSGDASLQDSISSVLATPDLIAMSNDLEEGLSAENLASCIASIQQLIERQKELAVTY